MAKVGISKWVTSEAATSSWVESGFDEHRTASAPPAASVRMRFAVSAVTCRQALMRQPSSGRSRCEPLADAGEHRHLPVRPLDLQRARHRPGRGRPRRPSSSRFAWPRESHRLSYRSHQSPAAGAPAGQALGQLAVRTVAEARVGRDGRVVVGVDVERDVVDARRAARRSRRWSPSSRSRGRGSRAWVITLPTTRDPLARVDGVRPGGAHQPAADAHAVVDAVVEHADGKPRPEAELVEPVEVVDVERREPLAPGRRRARSWRGRRPCAA